MIGSIRRNHVFPSLRDILVDIGRLIEDIRNNSAHSGEALTCAVRVAHLVASPTSAVDQQIDLKIVLFRVLLIDRRHLPQAARRIRSFWRGANFLDISDRESSTRLCVVQGYKSTSKGDMEGLATFDHVHVRSLGQD